VDRPSVVERVIAEFLGAVARRDLEAVGLTLDADVRWANVPHPAAVGSRAVLEMLSSVIGRAQRVRWDLVSAAYESDRAHLERVDRFWIGGTEYAARCHGVFVVDPAAGRILEVRDYVDLGEWRSRLALADRETNSEMTSDG
jgi:limonene-1,2-epoxide hydrolase